MPRYLTPEWLEAAQQAVDADEALAKATVDVRISVQQIVTGGPDGDAAYRVEIDEGTVRLVGGETPAATVTFVQDWQTASAIGRGELSAQGAFMSGLIRVRGDLLKLVECAGLFSEIDDVFSGLRAQTTY